MAKRSGPREVILEDGTIVGPATARERAKAAAIRQARRDKREVSARQRRWLAQYELERAAYRRSIAESIGPATESDRSRAAAARAARRAGKATPEQRAFLSKYDRERREFRNATGRAKRDDFAERLARAMGMMVLEPGDRGGERVTRRELANGGSETFLTFDSPRAMFEEKGASPTPDLPDDASGSVAIRVQFERGDGTREWVSIVAHTDRWDTIFSDFEDEVDSAADYYMAEGIAAIAIYHRR